MEIVADLLCLLIWFVFCIRSFNNIPGDGKEESLSSQTGVLSAKNTPSIVQYSEESDVSFHVLLVSQNIIIFLLLASVV